MTETTMNGLVLPSSSEVAQFAFPDDDALMAAARARQSTGGDRRSVDEAFPDVAAGIEPLGSRILVQLRSPMTRWGSLILTQDTIDTERDNIQIGKVLAMGPLAFHNRETGKEWVEKPWVKVGDYVRVPKYGERWVHPVPDSELEFAYFALVEDFHLIGKITGDPLLVKAFL